VIRIDRKVRGAAPMVDVAYVPRLCNHCDDAPCVRAGGGAVRQREDGIVLIDPVHAKGRRDLVDACPYGAIVWNEAQQLPQHWFFDAHLLDAGWPAPRCVGVCPTQAIEAVQCEDEHMARRAQVEGLRPLHPEWATRPRVHYRNLHRADRCFVGGYVVAQVNGRLECLADVEVLLQVGDREHGRMSSDPFGAFKFDGLAPQSGPCELRLTHPLHGSAACCFDLGDVSVALGDVLLQP
jgi:Fe-S-cluster-containing dehydrogenase component